MSALLQFSFNYQTISCCECNMIFAVPMATYKRLIESSSNWFFCPSGHKQHYAEGEVERLKKQIDSEIKRRQWAENDTARANISAERQERRARAYKSVITRTKNRIKNGVCPCCKQNFSKSEESHDD